jgi:hypothetical protein
LSTELAGIAAPQFLHLSFSEVIINQSPDLALSKNSVVGPRASGFSSGKDGEAGDIGSIVDGAGHRPDGKQAARSQIEFFDIAIILFTSS